MDAVVKKPPNALKEAPPATQTVFENVFLGEFVDIVTKVVSTSQTETEEGLVETRNRVMLRGFILDVDKDFIYMGSTESKIESCLNKKEIVTIEISDGIDQSLIEYTPAHEREIN
jgi:hypothetical protein